MTIKEKQSKKKHQRKRKNQNEMSDEIKPVDSEEMQYSMWGFSDKKTLNLVNHNFKYKKDEPIIFTHEEFFSNEENIDKN